MECSIVGLGIYVDYDVHVIESIIFFDVCIGVGACFYWCIVDKNVIVFEWGCFGFDFDVDRERFVVSDGGVFVVEKGRDLG